MPRKFNPLVNKRLDYYETGGGGGAADGFNRVSAGTQLAGTNATVVFSNSNNVTFGMSNNSIVTASASMNQSTQPVALSGSNGSFNFSTATFGNLNGLSFYTSNGSMVGSYTVPTQSVQTQGMVSINGSTGAISLATGSSLSSSSNGSTITFGLASNITTALQSAGAYLTTAAQSNHSHAFSASGGSSNFQTLNFANSNGITFSNSNGSVIASHNALTTARASTDAIGLNTAQSNVTWTANSSGLSIDARGYAGTNTATTGSISVTLNSSGISLNAPAFLTTAMASNRGSDFVQATAAFAGTNASGTIASNGISVSVAAPGAAAENNWNNLLGANTAGNTTASGSTIGWSGQNITLSGTNGSQIVISAPAVSSLSATGNVSVSTNGSTISVGAPIPNFSAGTTSNSFNNLVFSNSNGVSFGLNGSTITATVATNYQSQGAYLTTAMASNRGTDFVQATAAFNGTNASGTIASNGISISVAAPGGGGVNTAASTNIPGELDYAPSRQFSSSSFGQNSLYMYPMIIDQALTGSILRIPMFITNSSSAVSSGQKGQTIRLGIYTTNDTNATVLTLWQSTSYTIAASFSSNVSWAQSMITGVQNTTSYNSLTASSAGLNLSASLHGQRDILMPVTASFSSGTYWFAFHHSTSGAGTVGNVLNISQPAYTWATFNRLGVSTAASGSGLLKDFGIGTYSVTTGAMPSGISATMINQSGLAPIFYIGNETA